MENWDQEGIEAGDQLIDSSGIKKIIKSVGMFLITAEKDGNIMKAGVLTSEFWLALFPWILAAIVLIGVVLGSIDMEKGLLLLGALGISGSYTASTYAKGRSEIKKNQ